MGLDLAQFKSLIVAPALTSIGLGGQTAINLVTGTALKESSLTYLKQLGTGPALGLCQIEPVTHDYLWTLPSMLSNKPDLVGMRIRNYMSWPVDYVPSDDYLVSDLSYAVIMCRIKYLSVKDPLPANNAMSLAAYWKKIYNSVDGAGRADAATEALFQQAIDA